MESLIELIELIERRKGMFFPNPNVFLLRAFFDGWSYEKDPIINDAGDDVFYGFQKFLQNQYNMDESMSWDNIVYKISGNDEDSFNMFFKLFKSYVSSIEKSL